MGGAFLGAMDMKISQSDAFFNALSSWQVKMRLYRVKMMSYKETLKKQKIMGGAAWGNQKASFREFSGPKIKNVHVPEKNDFFK